jgi:hypothetical protein
MMTDEHGDHSGEGGASDRDGSVIDLSAWVRARDEEAEEAVSPLSLLGADGERRRYVLPLWRMAYLLSARWAAIQRDPVDTGSEAAVVLDLRRDPARREPGGGLHPLRSSDQPPAMRALRGGAFQFPLGETGDGVRWSVVIADRDERIEPDPSVRDDLLFLAGECAGLLSLIEDRDPEE